MHSVDSQDSDVSPNGSLLIQFPIGSHLPGFEKDTKWPQLAVSDQIVKTFVVFRSFVNLQGLALKTKTFKQEKTLHHCF